MASGLEMNNIIWVGAADRALIPKMPEEYEKFVYNGSTKKMHGSCRLCALYALANHGEEEYW